MSPVTPSKHQILDCHVHYGDPEFKDGLIQVMDQMGVEKFNVVCTPHPTRLSLIPDALHLKAHLPDRVFVFGGLDISALFTASEKAGMEFARYVDILLGMGCDGVKMIEGKPDMRKRLQIPAFDGPVYQPYWEKMDASGTPLIFHVNDPAEFWDPEKIPGWAKESGWFYGDGTYINNEAQYQEIINVLRRYPNLKVVFAHFLFLSQDLPRLAGYLDMFPGMHIDLTPGIEMYHNFAGNLEKTREFFIKYQDRILFGTDIGAKAMLASPENGIEPGESKIRHQLVKGFLEKEGELVLDTSQGYLFDKFGGNFKGIKLPDDVLKKICHRNFERLAGETPRPLNPEKIIAECERLAVVIVAMGAAQPGMPGDPSVAKMVSQFFQQPKI
jgi:predicted TIM-barrel fold metal-dependent hydrolase